MATNVQEIFGIQESILINIIQENLRNCAFVWSKVSPVLYQTNSLIINGFVWDVRIGKNRTSSGTIIYYLEVVKDGRIFVSLTSSANSQVQSLFNTAEEMFSLVKGIEEEAISVLDGCRCIRTHDMIVSGGVVVGGITGKTYEETMVGGVVVGGGSDTEYFDPPSGNCKVQFSGIFIGDILNCNDCVHPFNTTHGCCGSTSTTFSEIVGTGQTTNAAVLLPNAHATSFDSLAVWPGARLVIKKEDGSTIIDVTGPFLIYYSSWKNSLVYGPVVEALRTKTLVGTDSDGTTLLNDVFPPNVRVWSDDGLLGFITDPNMHTWSNPGNSITIDCS